MVSLFTTIPYCRLLFHIEFITIIRPTFMNFLLPRLIFSYIAQNLRETLYSNT